MAQRPADMPPAPAVTEGRPDDLLDTVLQTTIKRSAVLTLSEEEVNRHLTNALKNRVRSQFPEWATLEGGRLDLQPNVARLFLIWNFKGFTRTVSVDLSITRDDKNFQVEMLRGAYGRLNLPRGMMRPLYPMLRMIAEALDPEIRALFQMTKITIEQDKLVLDPRFPNA